MENYYDPMEAYQEFVPVPMIQIEHLTKIYGEGPTAVTALNDINMTVNKGDIHGVIGLSGAGKSTLVRCVNRLDEPTSGKIVISDKDILTLGPRELREMRKRVSMIFQHFNLLMQKTVFQNVRYPLDISHVPRDKADARVKELLEIVGLSDKAHAYPSQMSGGQKQRVAIARALATDPEVLLCDEATSALDPMTTQAILDLLQDINKRTGITILLITHEMAAIRQICSKVSIIDKGSIVEEGFVDEVFTNTKSSAGRKLFGIFEDGSAGGIRDALRIIVDGDNRSEPMLANFILQSGVAVNILSADITRIGGKSYGQILLELPDSITMREFLIMSFRRLGFTVQEVHADDD